MGDFQGKSYVCLKEYYPKGYNFAKEKGQLIQLSPVVTTMITTVDNCTTNNNRRSLAHK